MQGLTIAIGPVGVAYFGQSLLAADLTRALAGLTPPNRGMDAPGFETHPFATKVVYSNIHIDLSNGGFRNFTPTYGTLVQQAGGHFQVALSAANFDVNYSWNETWHTKTYSYGRFPPPPEDKDHSAGPFGYPPHFASLAVQLVLAFTYDQATKAYDVTVDGVTAAPSGVTPNVPAASVIQNEDQSCFSSHVSDATAGAVASIDFKSPIATLFGSLFKTIPASGNLTPDIVYDFEVGDAPLTFPGDKGLTVGVTGTVTYKGEAYPGKPPPPLAVPPVPTDANHLRLYVSSYELDALNWAFFKAGALTYTLNPDDLPDPDILKVKTYVGQIQALQQYQAFAMQAQVTPKQASTTSFQLVWEFTKQAMQELQRQLPAGDYQNITSLDGNNYVAEADLDSDLKAMGVQDPKSVATIKRVTQTMGMVVRHNLEFKLTIQNRAPNPPDLVFDLVRTDVLQNLSLGASGNAQTLKYDFKKVTATATFVSTTIPRFDKVDFGTWIWPIVGEPRYDEELTKIGHGTGVPLPIMQGFHFLFDQAQLSIQDGYVSILAQVQFKQ
jgi:hypothetical protein